MSYLSGTASDADSDVEEDMSLSCARADCACMRVCHEPRFRMQSVRMLASVPVRACVRVNIASSRMCNLHLPACYKRRGRG